MKEEWLMPGAVVPVDVETTAALVAEIKRLISVVGGMALNQQRTWVGLDWNEMPEIYMNDKAFEHGAQWAEAKLKEKNT